MFCGPVGTLFEIFFCVLNRFVLKWKRFNHITILGKLEQLENETSVFFHFILLIAI